MPEPLPVRVLMITGRADIGGGPEHLWHLLRNLPANCIGYMAAPTEKPFWPRYQQCIGEDRMIPIPHRRFSLSAFIRLWQFCRSNKITVIHSHGKCAGLYSRLLKLLLNIKCIHTFHGVHADQYQVAVKGLYCLYERLMSLCTDTVVAVSAGEQKLIQSCYSAKPERVVVVFNGIPLFQNSSGKAAQPGCIKLCAITRFNYQKNPDLLIDIASELEDRVPGVFELTVFGAGSGLQDFRQQLLKRKTCKLVLAGEVNDLRQYLNQFDICLSTSRWEGLPLVLLEAMAEGVAIVATDVAGNQDVITHGESGFLYPLGDASSAVRHIVNLVSDQQLYSRVIENADHEVNKRFSDKTMGLKTGELYSCDKG